MNKITSTDDIVNQVLASIKMFGLYTFYDKGLYEVCDTEPILAFLKEHTGEDAGKILVSLLDHPKLSDNDIGRHTVKGLILDLDTQPEEWFNVVMDTDNRFEELY